MKAHLCLHEIYLKWNCLLKEVGQPSDFKLKDFIYKYKFG